MNMFVISTVGQLIQVQNLIKNFNLNDKNLLVVLEGKNKEIVKNILARVEKEFFYKTKILKLPNKNNVFSLTQKNIYDLYLNLFQEYKVSSLFLCSVENHYNFLADIAKKNKIKINLVEEGAGTYKFLLKKNKKKLNKKLYKEKIKKFLKKLYLGNLLLKYYYLYKNRNKDKYPKEINSFHGIINSFNEIYVAYPEKAKKIYKAKKYNELKIDYSLSKEQKEKFDSENSIHKITKDTIIFVNQDYKISIKSHVNYILDYLESLDSNNILLKFHPKDSKEMKKEFINEIKKRKLTIDILEFKNEWNLETIITYFTIKEIIGIASSSFLYTAKLSKNITLTSIGEYYSRRLKKDNFIKESKIVERDLEIIKSFNLEQIKIIRNI